MHVPAAHTGEGLFETAFELIGEKSVKMRLAASSAGRYLFI